MSEDWFTDIEAPAESSSMRSKDIYNRVVLVRPTSAGEDVGDDGPYSFWNCDVVIINQAGIEDHSSNVRIAWKLVQKGLANRQGSWILAKVVQKGNAWVLDPGEVSSAATEVARANREAVLALFDGPREAAPAGPVPGFEDGSEPF